MAAVTVVNAPQTTTTSNVKQGDTVISELTVDECRSDVFSRRLDEFYALTKID